MRAHVVLIRAPGEPEVLELHERELGAPAPGEALVRQTCAGVNYIDIQHRSGRYPQPAYPAGVGVEAAGVVEAIGAGVTEVVPGDRVAYVTIPPGAYASARLISAERLVPVPAAIDDVTAGANLLRGFTAQYLVKSTYAVKAGDVVLLHAAAGGVGVILGQWARHLGATVIGTVGSDAKVEIARRNGCEHVIVYTREDFAKRVRELTDGVGAHVVYDGVGATTFEGSLASLRPRGTLCTYGTPSGPIPPFDVFQLNRLGSLYLTSPSNFTYTRDRGEMLERARDFFDAIARGIIRIETPHRYPLAEAARAHADLQARRTAGGVALLG